MALVRWSRCVAGLNLQQQRLISNSIAAHFAQDKPSTSEASAAVAAQSKASTSESIAKQDWTEVVDEKTGGTYYWNQTTGETTNVGEPKPLTRFRDPSYEEYYSKGQNRQNADPQDIFAPSWKEPGQPDRTMYYIFLGGVIGIFAGWTARFTH